MVLMFKLLFSAILRSGFFSWRGRGGEWLDNVLVKVETAASFPLLRPMPHVQVLYTHILEIDETMNRAVNGRISESIGSIRSSNTALIKRVVKVVVVVSI